MNLANKITIFRIFLIPILVLIPFLPIPEETFLGINYTMWCLAIVFSIGALSDKLDGYIARSRNMITNFGKFADPLADKILVISAMMMLIEFGKLPSWVVIIIIAREFIVSGYRLVAVSKENNVIAASIWGKLKTVLQLIAVIMLMLDPNSFGACFNRKSNRACICIQYSIYNNNCS